LAENSISYKAVLWKMVVDFALESNRAENLGELLESAALCGADLSKLVAEIPRGIEISGLKQKLLAAVTDYRNVLSIHIESEKVGKEDHLHLLRCKSHIIRRGVSCQLLGNEIAGGVGMSGEGIESDRLLGRKESDRDRKTRIPCDLATIERTKRSSNVENLKLSRMSAVKMYRNRQKNAVVIR